MVETNPPPPPPAPTPSNDNNDNSGADSGVEEKPPKQPPKGDSYENMDSSGSSSSSKSSSSGGGGGGSNSSIALLMTTLTTSTSCSSINSGSYYPALESVNSGLSCAQQQHHQQQPMMYPDPTLFAMKYDYVPDYHVTIPEPGLPPHPPPGPMPYDYLDPVPELKCPGEVVYLPSPNCDYTIRNDCMVEYPPPQQDIVLSSAPINVVMPYGYFCANNNTATGTGIPPPLHSYSYTNNPEWMGGESQSSGACVMSDYSPLTMICNLYIEPGYTANLGTALPTPPQPQASFNIPVSTASSSEHLGKPLVR